MRILATLLYFSIITGALNAQNLPLEVNISADGRLTYGGNPTEGFYKTADVNKLEITLTQTNWFQLMDGGGGPNGDPGELLVGTLTYNDTLVLDSVRVGIKGQTSDFQNNSEKKSFKIEIDELVNQDLEGYDNLNLNCGFQDHSSMREVLYYDLTRSFAPAMKGSFVDLYINGQYWGPYNNIQQIEGTYIKEWFTDNEGTRWRARRTTGGGGGPGGPNFGAGTSTLNYNGPDSSDYNEDYTLKKADKDNPWEDLIEACNDLNNLPISDLYDELKYTLDIDRALWFLVQEIIFADDDSYINKGGMDYYVYWDHATDRIIPMEVDGNSVLADNHIDWGPFYKENNTDFPLLNRLLQNTEVRQRYLAHLRTALEMHFAEQDVHNRIDEFAAILDQRVQDDPKKIYSYNQFLAGVQSLKDIISQRIDILSNHTEVNQVGVDIANLIMETTAGVGMPPEPNEEVLVNVEVVGSTQKVMLYYGEGLDGVYERTEMFDDGLHGDQQANDNIYGANIPGFLPGNYVRYYVEAIKNDAASTASYFPEGAEHDVYIYQVGPADFVPGDVVINEFMAKNESSITDDASEFEDWIELYNKGTETVDLTGYFLSDNESNVTKWQFPDNTLIAADDYLIIWADDDENQTTLNELHANFKLSSDGEVVVLVNSVGEIIDQINFDEQQEDLSFARKPNGIGDFEVSDMTFNISNDSIFSEIVSLSDLVDINIYPNPAKDAFTINFNTKTIGAMDVMLVNSIGQTIWKNEIEKNSQIDISNMESGIHSIIIHLLDQDIIQVKRIAIID